MQGKYEQLKAALEKEDYKKAFSIARKFFFGIPEELKRSVEIGADVLQGKESFYKSLGVDTQAELEKAKKGLRELYLPAQ